MNISKELFVSKINSEGTCPVVIRVQHQGLVKRISTSVRCEKRNWQSKKCRVSCHDPDHRLKNEAIDTHYRRIAGMVQDYIDVCLKRNFDSIFTGTRIDWQVPPSPIPPPADASVTLAQLIRKKIDTIGRLNTRRGYEGFLRYVQSRFGDGPDTRQLDQQFINRFAEQLERDFSRKPAMSSIMASKFNAVVNFGLECRLVEPAFKPRFPRYFLRTTDRNLSDAELSAIFSLYRRKIAADTLLADEAALALAIFVLDIAFQGLAPVDLASLRVGDLVLTRVFSEKKQTGEESIEVVIANTTRKKTGRPVTIVAWIEPIREVVKALTRSKENDDYLIPCFCKQKVLTPEQRQNRLANYFNKMARLLNHILDEHYAGSDRLTHRAISFYYARHAFCNMADSLDIPRHIIQRMVGHKATTLEKNYLRPITLWEQALVSREIFRTLSDPS